MACSRKSGVVSMSTLFPPYSISTEGRVRRSRGSDDRQTAQSQPIVGTPMDVPLPRTVSVAFIVSQDSCPPPVAAGPGYWLLLHRPCAVRRDSSARSFLPRASDCPWFFPPAGRACRRFGAPPADQSAAALFPPASTPAAAWRSYRAKP